MAKATKIIRRSIRAFFQSYQSFAAAATLLVLPFSAVLLLSQSFVPSSSPILQMLSLRLYALFHAASFPATSQFFSLLNLKLSQTIFSFLFCLPFTLTFFVLAKAAIIQTVLESPQRRISIPSFSSLLRLYRLILPTHLFNSFVVLSANASVFSLLLISFNTLDIFGLSSDNCILGLSAASAVLYSIVLANTTVTCSLAAIISAMENCRG